MVEEFRRKPVSVCHFKINEQISHGPGCVKAPTIWAKRYFNGSL